MADEMNSRDGLKESGGLLAGISIEDLQRLRDIESVATHIVNHFLDCTNGIGPLPPNLFVLRQLLRREPTDPEWLDRYRAKGPCR